MESSLHENISNFCTTHFQCSNLGLNLVLEGKNSYNDDGSNNSVNNNAIRMMIVMMV